MNYRLKGAITKDANSERLEIILDRSKVPKEILQNVNETQESILDKMKYCNEDMFNYYTKQLISILLRDQL